MAKNTKREIGVRWQCPAHEIEEDFPGNINAAASVTHPLEHTAGGIENNFNRILRADSRYLPPLDRHRGDFQFPGREGPP